LSMRVDHGRGNQGVALEGASHFLDIVIGPAPMEPAAKVAISVRAAGSPE